MTVKDFLEKHRLHPEAYDADGLVKVFLSEMDAGLAGKESSLAMIPSYISAGAALVPGERVAVIDAGGTNLRVASAYVTGDRGICIDSYEKYPMPGSREEVTADAFFGALADYLRPALTGSERIGFCFSYPAEITPEKDGRLIKWTKEMQAPGVIGRLVGEGLLQALGPAGVGKRIVLLNDTIATLLAGKSKAGRREFDSYIGFILGTGTNIAYLEKNGNIGKAEGLSHEGIQAINVESASFSKTPRGDMDEALDLASSEPGSQQLEKMISGRYLPEIILMALNKGCEEGVFTGTAAAFVQALPNLSHDLMAALATDTDAPFLSGLSSEDRRVSGIVVKAIIERAGKLAAVNVAAAVIKAVGEQGGTSVCINIDGSTYYKAPGLREHTEAYLEKLLGARGISCELLHVDRSPLIGAAIAGLVN